MTSTMTVAAMSVDTTGFNSRYTGTPHIPARPKQISCRFVRLNATLVFILDKSFGTGTYPIGPPFC